MRLAADTLAARIAIGFIAMALAVIAVFATLTLLLVDRDISSAAHRQLRSNVTAISGALQRAFNEDHSWTKADFAPVVALAHAYGVTLQMQAQSRTILALTAKAADGPTADFDVVSNGRVVAHVSLRQPTSGLTPAESGLKQTITTSIVLTALIALVLAVVGAALLGRHLARPLGQLAAAARRLGRGARATRVQIDRGPREVRELSSAFDAMAADLQLEDKLRRDLTANVAHELRTPLSILQAQTAALVDGVSDWTPDVAGSFAEEVNRLGRLVEDLETLAAAEAASLNLEQKPLRLDHVVIDAAERLRSRFDQRQITLRVEASPAALVGDSDRIQQIVVNLLTNAAKYAYAGGEVHVIVTSDAARSTLMVSDSGPGIPEEERSRVFERFVRGSTAADQPGSGIGLAVVRELVAAHGGTLRLDGSPDGGARFTLSFPAATLDSSSEAFSTGSTQGSDAFGTPVVSDSHMTRRKPPNGQPRTTVRSGPDALEGGDPNGQDRSRIIPPRP